FKHAGQAALLMSIIRCHEPGSAFPKRGSRDSVRKRSSRTDCGVRGQGDCLALWSTGPGYLRVLELSQEFPDPDGTILEYCRLIEGLSPDGRRLWTHWILGNLTLAT